MRFVRSDVEILAALADFRVACIGQLAIILNRNAHGMQRRIRALVKTEQVEVLTRALTPRRGRPEYVLTLTKAGRTVLQKSGSARGADLKPPKEVRHVEHQLLITEFRVQLVQLERLFPEFHVPDLSLDGFESGETDQRVGVVSRRGKQDAFVPDWVFALSHQELGKTILFFLEADRGTEPLYSGDVGRPFLQSKIKTYREYLSSGGYKRFESGLGTQLRGFRLLILSACRNRIAGLAALVSGDAHAEFVLLTDLEHLKSQGCWGPVWFAGGRLDTPPLSILGSKMPTPCPTPRDAERILRRDYSP